MHDAQQKLKEIFGKIDFIDEIFIFKAMSELGNKVKLIRGDLSQADFAKKTGLGLRTINKLEAGEPVRLDTVNQIAAAFALPDADRLNLVISWIKLEIGDDFQKLTIEPKNSSLTMKDAETLLGKIQVRVRDVPRKYQELILLTVQRPEILRCLENLNDLYDSIKKSE